MSIIKLISISQYVLAVYYTSAECYKYAVIDDAKPLPSSRLTTICANALRIVFEPDDIFYTSFAAEKEGREAINAVLD